MSCLGRERMFEHFSAARGTPVSIVRLNYAVEMRYGVIADLAPPHRCRRDHRCDDGLLQRDLAG